uniref:Amiloride-sensitive sodium channel subunit alpha n=2 Tax=Macrostomum lignano TaxID=282301 RepID=A0A1I8IVA8_9PLAT
MASSVGCGLFVSSSSSRVVCSISEHLPVQQQQQPTTAARSFIEPFRRGLLQQRRQKRNRTSVMEPFRQTPQPPPPPPRRRPPPPSVSYQVHPPPSVSEIARSSASANTGGLFEAVAAFLQQADDFDGNDEVSPGSWNLQESSEQQQKQKSTMTRQKTEPSEFSSETRKSFVFSSHRLRTVKAFLDNSTFHGLWRVQPSANKQNLLSRKMHLLWTLIVIAAISCLWLHVYKQVSRYFKYPLQSSTREILNDFHFPSVTICEAWQMKFFKENYKSVSLRLANEPEDYLNMTYWLFDVPKSENTLQYLSNSTAYGLSVLDLLIDCKLNGLPCDKDSFSAFYHRQYGNCFTFDAEVHHDEKLGHSGSRVHEGLSLILYSPSSDPYFRNFSDPVPLDSSGISGLEIDGVLVTAHEANTVPRVSEDSIIAATSHETKIGLKEVRTTLVNTPARPCHESSNFRVHDHLVPIERTYKTSLPDRLEWEDIVQVLKSCNCLASSPVGVPTHLANYSGVRQCADLFDALRGDFPKYRNFRNHECQEKFNRDKFSCREKLLKEFPALARNWEEFQCYQRLTNQSFHESDAQVLEADDQCSSISYQFQIFTSELPDSQSASWQFGRYDARLIFQTFSTILDRYLKRFENSREDELPAVVRSVRSKGLRPGECTTMIDRKFKDEENCSDVQEFISRHFLRVQVYPFSLSVVHIAEERSYSIVDLFSHLGGILGLWVGSSIVSLFELLELVTFLSASSLSFSLNKRLQKSNSGAAVLRYPVPSMKPPAAAAAAGLSPMAPSVQVSLATEFDEASAN